MKWGIALVVIYGVWQNLQKAIVQVQDEGFQFAELRWPFLVAAGLIYLIGSLPAGMFWYRLMRAMGQRPELGSVFRAFYIGHLGKYVPGKALVVVLRTALVRGDSIQRTVVATAVFSETLTMVAVGGVYAAVLIALFFTHQTALLALALIIAVGGVIVTSPPIFRKIVLVLRVAKLHPEIQENLKGLSWPVMLWGWAANLVGWSLLGGSLFAVMHAIPAADLHLSGIVRSFPLLTATICLAMVAGFISPLPGGVGVREWVIIEMLAPDFGPVIAVVSAVLLRMTWLLAEVLFAMILYPLPLGTDPHAVSENPAPIGK
ncbi:MAG: lysylphosphatidylglycerol synthase transmembrane domain-containing protein [Pirellulaceae bacterium]